MSPIHRLTDSALEHLADIDHDHHEAIGVFDDSRLIASAHWFRSGHQPYGVEIAVDVTDHYQRRGVGLRLLRQLGRRARTRGILQFGATMLTENTGAIALVRATGWCISSTLNGPELTVAMELDAEV
jgi:GNAT superfamily N-acetyltransferase